MANETILHDLGEETLRGDGVSAATPPQPLQSFFVMAETPCPYLTGQWERKLITEIYGTQAGSLYANLSRGGFRRSHHFAYRPACSGCRACVPVRVRACEFRPSRSLRRIARMNSDLTVFCRPAAATAEQFAVFADYMTSRHGDGEMAGMTRADYRAMVENSSLETNVVEFRDGDDTLVAACLADWLDDGASAVYSFFTGAAQRRSLGSYCILWLIEETARRRLPYVYLGYWIEGARKMAYKSRFQPLEALTDVGWREICAGNPTSDCKTTQL